MIMEISNQFFLKAVGLWRLFRFLPVLSWSICAFALGVGLAAGSPEYIPANWGHVALVALAGMALQGITAHAYNDLEDWRSGTDRKSPGILSGGTRVIRDGLLGEGSLSMIGLAGLLLPVIAGIYFSMLRGPMATVFLLVGMWACLAYTLPPFRLAYRPWLGEWLAAFPAILSCTAGSFFVLTGHITVRVLVVGTLHGLFSLGWLMQHHLSDLFADLEALPPKITTVAFAYQRWGLTGAGAIPAAYFSLAALGGSVSGFFLNPVFFLAVVPALLCIYLAVTTDPLDVYSITGREKGMIALTSGHAVVLAVLLGMGY